ncbi:MAG: polysaccharide deacetylase family protein [Alphaproteobacteria bacterium]
MVNAVCHRSWRLIRMLIFGALAGGAVYAAAPARAESAAVILMYHRFGEENLPSTNIRLEQFVAHIEELTAGGYTVLPVPDIIAALRTGTSLPDRTIGITIDDAFASVYREAWPRLREAGFPFTVFVSTNPIDAGVHGMMTWDEIRELANAGVTIGHHGASHAHMAEADNAANGADIDKASARFRDELGRAPELFAYPYGEYSRALAEQVAAVGFTAAFGQHSGVAHDRENLFGLPRFALNEAYGDIDRFKLVTSTLALPVSDLTPSDPVIGDNNPPAIGFTVAEGVDGLSRINCFASGQGATTIERLGPQRVEVRLKAPFPPGRSRINCTLPGRDGRWRWLGMLFLVPGG